MNNDLSPAKPTFLETKEYRRFAEFCDACKQHRYIGLCHGYPGVGKTLSAWQYAKWHLIQPYFPERFYLKYRLNYIEGMIAKIIATNLVPLPPEIGESRSILYTPAVTNTPKQVELEIQAVRLALSHLVDTVQNGLPQKSAEEPAPRRKVPDVTDLIIIDEADRLKMATLEREQAEYRCRHLQESQHLAGNSLSVPASSGERKSG
jgi:hypothetical protein